MAHVFIPEFCRSILDQTNNPIVHPIFRTPYPFIQYNPENVRPCKDDFYLLHYSDKFFTKNIYKSIVPAKKRLSLPTDEDPKSSTLKLFFSLGQEYGVE